MGFAGAHIGGHGLTYEMLENIVDTGEKLAPSWQDLICEFDYPQNNGFYFFMSDDKTGLNLPQPAPRLEKSSRPLIALLAKVAHAMFFQPESPWFKLLKPVAKFLNAHRKLRLAFTDVEHIVKVVLFGCMNCGDCALFDVAYLCPVSQCPKNQRNGPCGGSYEGWCEIYPNQRKCVWIRAYKRLKAAKKEAEIGDNIVPPCNWELWDTSSWLNFYLGLDHSAKRMGIKPPSEEKK